MPNSHSRKLHARSIQWQQWLEEKGYYDPRVSPMTVRQELALVGPPAKVSARARF